MVVVAVVAVVVGDDGGSYNGKLSRNSFSPCIDTTLALVLVLSPQNELATGFSPCSDVDACSEASPCPCARNVANSFSRVAPNSIMERDRRVRELNNHSSAVDKTYLENKG